jgi:hypothetical protein
MTELAKTAAPSTAPNAGGLFTWPSDEPPFVSRARRDRAVNDIEQEGHE